MWAELREFQTRDSRTPTQSSMRASVRTGRVHFYLILSIIDRQTKNSVCIGKEAVQISVSRCMRVLSFKDTETPEIGLKISSNAVEVLTSHASYNDMREHAPRFEDSFPPSRSALRSMYCTSTHAPHALRFATEFSIALQFNSPTFVSLIHDDTIMFGKNWLKRGGCQNHPASKFLGLLHFVVSQRNFFQTF